VNGADAVVKRVEDVGDNDMILDVGPQTAAQFADMLKSANHSLERPGGRVRSGQFGKGTENAVEGHR
jgi:phosphoglycerate kinase